MGGIAYYYISSILKYIIFIWEKLDISKIQFVFDP